MAHDPGQNAAMRALLGPVCLALLPLAMWPGLARPFSTPKLAWMATLVLVLAWPAPVAWADLSARLRWSAMAWIASFLLAAAFSDLWVWTPLALGVLAPCLALALARSGVAPSRVAAAQAAGATACAVVAVMQWIGADPLAWFGWQLPVTGASVRMRVYGTLGNPNFVGVLMAMSLPITAAVHREVSTPRWRRVIEVALAAQAAALVATGSRGAVLGLGAAMMTYAWLRWSRRVRLAAGGLLVFAAVAVVVSPARPLDTTAAGRLHLWRIVGPYAFDAPLVGQGPGAVPERFPDWQRHAAREGLRDRRFAGLTDHAHNDYIEALIERGVPGVLTLLVPLGLVGVAAWRSARPTSPVMAGACAAVTAGAACALVDFPLARPAELAWWWTSLAVAFETTRPPRA
jgi:putative inorganic carbon (hco3(-)) transporter